MLTLKEAWGTTFYPTQLAPKDLAVMVVAASMNLTGARSIVEASSVSNCGRAAAKALCFNDAASFIQRNYRKHPDLRVVILGSSLSGHCIVVDADGCPVADSNSGSRMSYVPNVAYTYLIPYSDVPWSMDVAASVSIVDAVRCLNDMGYWKDNAWGYDKSRPRGGDYL